MLTTGTFIVKMHKAQCVTSFKSAVMQQFSNTNAILVQAQKCHSMEYFIFKNILTLIYHSLTVVVRSSFL